MEVNQQMINGKRRSKMKTKGKRIIAILLTIFMTVNMCPTSFVMAENKETAATVITVDEVNASSGDTINVIVSIKNNPGILGAVLKLEYGEGLTLTGAENGEVFSSLTMTKPGKYVSPCKFLWEGQEISDNDIIDGSVLVLSFKVSDDVQAGTAIPVKVSYSQGDIVDGELNAVEATLKDGYVLVDDYLPGDLNGDNKVNTTDVILMSRYITGGYDISINENAADVNADGKCNTSDIILLRRYIAGGYGVKLLCRTEQISKKEHELKRVEFKAASCTENGNTAYWYCEECSKYYSDEKEQNEISLENTIIPAVGHTIVIDPAVEATYTSDGLTEGSHCSVCNMVLVKQEIIPKLEEKQYAITYNLYAGDPYLASVGINNPNPTYYTSDGLRLKSLSAEGYLFEGWYDGEGKSATKITKIDAGETGEIELFAHWSLVEYEVQFDSPLVEVSNQTYTVNEGLTLKNPNLSGYNFMGWTDEKGNIVTSIKQGTAGTIKLKANWTSKRNQTKPVKKLEDPIIVEDTDQGQILFAYEIGTIENVPLYDIKQIGNAVNGLVQVDYEQTTKSISETNAKTIAQTISNATTNSQSWTLSEDWNEITSVSESYLEQTGESQTDAETNAKTSSNTYSLNSSSGGSSTTVDSNGASSKIGDANVRGGSNTNTSTTTSSQGYEYGVTAKVSGEVGMSTVKIGAEIGGSVSVSGSNSYTNTNTGTTSWDNTHSEESTADTSHVSTAASTWNSSSGYSNSNSTSQSKTVSNTLSTLIAETKGYGSSYAEGGSRSDAQAFSTTATESNEYSSTLTYYTSETTTKEKTYTMSGETEGYYRVVEAGTVHVFAVVGYDVATKSYFVYTYNVLDDNTYEFVDYSRSTANFNDEENGVLPFEVPIFVNDYVNSVIAKSDDLEINIDTGMISKYTGDDAAVIIPSYISVDNKDGTSSAIKVTGIEPGVFKGNTKLVSIKLSDFITEIPDSEFKGCTALKDVIANGVTTIGDNAFSGCTSLNKFDVPIGAVSLGNNAFKDVNEISVTASTPEIAQAATNSGAKRIVLDISSIADTIADSELEVSSSSDYFELRGKDKTYSGLKLRSNAKNTVINGVTFADCAGIPLEIESEELTLNRVSATCSGYVMMLSSDNTKISLQGTIDLASENGNAIVCRNVSLSQLDSSIAGRLKVSGNIYVCGNITQNNCLTMSNGNIITINEDEYAKYIKGSYNINFDANGGIASEKSKVAYCGNPLGKLPTATRDYYSFEGWYTKKEGGEKVTDATTYSTTSDITLYAHWKIKCTSDWVEAGAVPANAQVVNTKWSYTLREYTTNSASSYSGWTKYDTKRTSWGATQGPVYSDPNNGVRNVWSESYVTSSNYKTIYHYFRYANSWSGGGGSDISGTSYGSNYYTYDFDYELTIAGTNGNNSRGYKYYYNAANGNTASGSYMTVWKCNPFTTQQWVSDNYGTRWYYQEPVYTYYYYRDLEKEANADPSGQDNVSNVQKWVQYREK